MAVTRTNHIDPVPGFDDAHPAAPEPEPGMQPMSVSDPTIDVSLLRRYKDLRSRQAEATAEADAYREEANRIEAHLIEMFTDAGLQNLNVDGKTIFLHRTVYAQRRPGKTAEDVIAALRAAGVGELVRPAVNAQTLSAYVRELTEDDDAPGLPDEVAEVLEPGERYSVRINAAGARPKSKTHSK